MKKIMDEKQVKQQLEDKYKKDRINLKKMYEQMRQDKITKLMTNVNSPSSKTPKQENKLAIENQHIIGSSATARNLPLVDEVFKGRSMTFEEL